MEIKPSTDSQIDVPMTLSPSTPAPQQNRNALIVLVSIFVLILLFLALFFDKLMTPGWIQDIAYTTLGRKNPNILPLPSPTIPPTPTPSYLPPGIQTYTISSHSNGPKVTSITLDPLDAHIGDKQIITITSPIGEQIINAAITIFSDTKKTTLKLTAHENEWGTNWILNDSTNKRYIFRIDVTDSSTTSSTLVAPRTTGPIHLDDLK